MKVSPESAKEIEAAWKEYEQEVRQLVNMSEETKRTYLLHSRNFVRWLKGDFQPGVKTG